MEKFKQWYVIKHPDRGYLRFLSINGFADRGYFTKDLGAATKYATKAGAEYVLEEHPSILYGCKVLLATNTKPQI